MKFGEYSKLCLWVNRKFVIIEQVVSIIHNYKMILYGAYRIAGISGGEIIKMVGEVIGILVIPKS